MARLTCVYCNNVISRSDTKCPYCGAETESSIKKFTAVREADIENNKTLLAALNKEPEKTSDQPCLRNTRISHLISAAV